MINLVARAFGKKKKKKPQKAANPTLQAPKAAAAKPQAEPSMDDLSLEELEDMVVTAPEPKPEPKADAKPETKATPPATPVVDDAPAPPAPPAARAAIARSAPAPTPQTAPGEDTAMSQERAALLRDAMATHRRVKNGAFDELDDAAREKLYVMAMKTMVDKDFGEK